MPTLIALRLPFTAVSCRRLVVLDARAFAAVRAGLFAAVGNADASFWRIVLVSDSPVAVALVAAPRNRHRFGLDGVFWTDRADRATELAAVGQA